MEQVQCGACGAAVPLLAFCTACGNPLVPASAAVSPAPSPAACASCGAAVGSNAFCVSCGASTGLVAPGGPPVDATAAVPAPTHVAPAALAAPAAGPARARRGRTVAALVALPVVALAATGGWWALGRGDDGGSAASSSAAGSAGVAQPGGDEVGTAPSPSETPSGSASPSASPSATPSTSPAAPPVARCWSGERVETVSECEGEPAGRAGLTWVFPSLDSASCVDAKATAAASGQEDPAPLREFYYRCPTPLSGGVADIRYYGWYPGTDAAREARYAEKFADGERREVRDRSGRLVRTVWLNDVPDESGRYELTSSWAELPYSMSVYAATYADLEEALDVVLRFRAPEDLRGVTR